MWVTQTPNPICSAKMAPDFGCADSCTPRRSIDIDDPASTKQVLPTRFAFGSWYCIGPRERVNDGRVAARSAFEPWVSSWTAQRKLCIQSHLTMATQSLLAPLSTPTLSSDFSSVVAMSTGQRALGDLDSTEQRPAQPSPIDLPVYEGLM